MFQKIIVPTDFSRCADNACDAAIHMANKFNAELIFLHSIETLVKWESMDFISSKNAILPEGEPTDLIEKAKKAEQLALKSLKSLVTDAKQRGVKASEHLMYNASLEDMLAFVDDSKTDLIIMGTQGASGVSELFVGTNSQKVVRQASCPVLTINEGQVHFEPKQLLYVSDFKSEQGIANLEKAAAICKAFNATLDLLYVNLPHAFEDSDTSIQRMRKASSRIKDLKVREHIVNHFSVEEGVWSMVKEKDIDLIVISIHGYTGIRRMLNNNVTESLVNHSSTPVLSVNM